MEAFEFGLDISADRAAVLQAFWDWEGWPKLAPHVRAVYVHYDDGIVQVATLEVLTQGRVGSFKSVRIRNENSITYIQPEPPPALKRHQGTWEFTPSPRGTRVTCRHEIELNPEAAATFLSEAGILVSNGQVQQAMQTVIRSNSLQTMLALKKCLEDHKGGSHAAEGLKMA